MVDSMMSIRPLTRNPAIDGERDEKRTISETKNGGEGRAPSDPVIDTHGVVETALAKALEAAAAAGQWAVVSRLGAELEARSEARGAGSSRGATVIELSCAERRRGGAGS